MHPACVLLHVGAACHAEGQALVFVQELQHVLMKSAVIALIFGAVCEVHKFKSCAAFKNACTCTRRQIRYGMFTCTASYLLRDPLKTEFCWW